MRKKNCFTKALAVFLTALMLLSVAPLAAMLQERLKNRIFAMTGIRVRKVGILVEAASEAKETKPAPVEQLPSRVK